MASTLNSVPAASSAAGNTANAQTNGRPSLRSSASTKGDGRRQSGSPVDGGQRYVPPFNSPLCPPSLTRSQHELPLLSLRSVIDTSWRSSCWEIRLRSRYPHPIHSDPSITAFMHVPSGGRFRVQASIGSDLEPIAGFGFDGGARSDVLLLFHHCRSHLLTIICSTA